MSDQPPPHSDAPHSDAPHSDAPHSDGPSPDADLARALGKLPTIDECVHCGLCLGACPTYELFGREVESPRGRIAALRKLGEGRELTPALAEGLEDCLVCRSCESACPSGISIEAMMAGYRAEARRRRPRWRDRWEEWALRHVIPHAGRRRWLSRLTRLARPALWLGGLELPSADRLRPVSYVIDQPRKPRGVVSIFRGCITDLWFRRETQASIRVLTRNGWRVELPEVGCCGALHRHAGHPELAEELGLEAARTVGATAPDFIVSDTAGCSAALAEPLGNDRIATEVGAKTIDTLGLLHREGFAAPADRLPGHWFVAPPCHHRHGPLEEAPTEVILDTVLAEGYRELPGPDHCCGAAGLYMVRRPKVSRAVGANALARFDEAVRRRSVEHPDADPPKGIISANAGCLLRWETLLEDRAEEAIHPVVALDRAYASE